MRAQATIFTPYLAYGSAIACPIPLLFRDDRRPPLRNMPRALLPLSHWASKDPNAFLLP